MFPMTRYGALAFLAIGLSACNNSRSPAAPAPLATVIVAPGTQGVIPIAGVVLDTAVRRLAGARIEVIDGPQAGMTTVTDSRGGFTLTGLFGDTTRFVATKSGYLGATSTLEPFCDRCLPNRWIYFNLEEPVPPPDLSGDWQVRFVTGACTGLPDELRTRSYDATIALAPPDAHPDARWLFVVTMNNVPFDPNYNVFHIGAAGNYLGFPESEGPALIELLDATTWLTFNALGWTDGVFTGATTGSIITTGFESTEYRSFSEHIQCAGNNRLTLIRR